MTMIILPSVAQYFNFMGAYVYRLKGSKAFTEIMVEGKLEKVFDLVYWYKPSYSSFWNGEAAWMKPIHMLDARLTNIFDRVGYPKFVRHAYEEKGKYTRSTEWVMEWKDGVVSMNDASTTYESLRRIRIGLPSKVDLSENMPPIMDQGGLGSSTSCALAAVLA
jgi:endoglucanase Acf2